MKNKILITVLILIVIGVSCYFIFRQKDNPSNETENAQLANPASVYCQEQGGTLENIAFAKGTRGFCLFDDNSQCGQWDFYRGDCAKGQLKIEILKEGTGELTDIEDVIFVHYTGTFEDGTKFIFLTSS